MLIPLETEIVRMTTATRSFVDKFHEEGYAVIEGLIPNTIIDPILKEYEGVLDRLANQLYESGEIDSPYGELGFEDRLTRIYEVTGRAHNQNFDFSLPLGGIERDTPFWAGPAVFEALVYEPLLDVIEELIGSEIYSNPIQHVRIKPPEKYLPKNEWDQPIIGPTIWHQDLGVANESADDSEVITAWFGLTDAPIKAGPLRVVPGSHRTGLLTHCRDYEGNGPEFRVPYVQIPERLFDVDHQVPLPTKAGDVILFDSQTVHGSLPNLGEHCRISFDLRYNRVGESTGRDIYPGFVARSRSNPDSELRDPVRWNRMWTECRDQLARETEEGAFEYEYSRWKDGHPDCEV
jgi:ectoine hydroxylase-related dioxygenase (phytanoyl-CoA dioxygenase family)